MKIFILEDNPDRLEWFVKAFYQQEIVLCNNADQAIGTLRYNEFDFIFLDHDLGGGMFVESDGPNTGWRVARHIPKDTKAAVVIHSLNPAGALAISQIIGTRVPFGSREFYKLVAEINRPCEK